MLYAVNSYETPGLDPKAKRIVDALTHNVPLAPLPVATMRRLYRESRAPYLWPLEDIASIEDLDCRDPVRPMLLFRPIANKTRGELATWLFFHGGGWTVGDIETYEPLCRKLANILHANIVWVDYRLAPEYPFPTPYDDASTACEWIIRNALRLGINPNRIGVIGDSAGANLAAAVALSNRGGMLGARFAAQVLFYPCLDLTQQQDSHEEFAQGYLLTRELYGLYVKNYLGPHRATDPLVSPLFANDLKGLAPAVIIHAGFDPLRDEAIAYAAKLRRARIPVKEIAFSDMIHGFLNMGAVLPQAEDALLCVRSSLHTLLANRLTQK
jgi:acetyl esterase